MTLPNLVVVGTLRSGSSSLNHYLSVHPDIFMARKKELQFFDHNFGLGLDWYEKHFEKAGGKKVVGECTPWYIYREDSLRKLADTLPSARLLVILRNPVDRAHSQYWMKRVRKKESRSFEEAVEEELPRFGEIGNDRPSARDYLSCSNYAGLLERLYEYRDRESVKVVCMENLAAAPPTVLNDVAGFLGITDFPDDPRLGRVVNRNLHIRLLWLRSLSKRFPRKAQSLVARLNSMPLEYGDRLDPAMHDVLQKKFEPLNRRLEQLTGLDFSVWDRPVTEASSSVAFRTQVSSQSAAFQSRSRPS